LWENDPREAVAKEILMRQFRKRASSLRFFLVVAAGAVVGLAASSPIHSAEAGGAAVRADCSEATARRLVEEHRLNHFDLPNPVNQVLCGPFTGPGSEAMAITIAAPTCWPVQFWAVFSFTGGDWQLVLNRSQFLNPPLVAVGSDIRETTPVFRAGDARCFPTGGTHARIWHWDGTRLVAGPWTQVTKGEPKARAFYSPSKNIYCGMSDNSVLRGVDCYSYVPPQKAVLSPAGRVTICRDRGNRNRCNIGNPGEGTPTLRYGRQITVGRFRCRSRISGVRCTVIRSGKGFLISRSGVRRVGP
jgi:hypothetical protein